MPEEKLADAIEEARFANIATVELWTYRSLFNTTWEAIKGRAPIEGIALVPLDSIICAAIAFPLGMWCLRAEYKARNDDEWDTNIIASEAPWLRDCPRLLGDLVWELQRHGNALICCESARLAQGLHLASRQAGRRRRFWVSLYSDRGLRMAGG